MAHKHSVYDTGNHFKINPITRAIQFDGESKPVLVQHDHNSERFTFEIPRYVDGHDMSLCDLVQIHYLNVASNRVDQHSDVYKVSDLLVCPDDDSVVICSWLLSQSATSFAGSLNFLLRFACTTGAVVDYSWNTTTYASITVANGMDNSAMVVEEYDDVLLRWEKEILPELVASAIDEAVRSTKIEDNTAAYIKRVPDTSAPYARIVEIGGATCKSHNVMPLEPSLQATTINGITFKVNEDGTISVTGTATDVATISITSLLSLPSGWYSLSGCPKGGAADTFSMNLRDGSNLYRDTGEGVSILFYNNVFSAFVAITVNYGVTMNHTFKPMLNVGTEPLPHDPYFVGVRSAPVPEVVSVVGGVRHTLPIPEAVRNLDGYGDGNPDNASECNSIRWEENGKRVYIHRGDIVNGNWVARATPQIDDISALLPADNLLPVESGGTVTMVNYYNYDVPSEVVFYEGRTGYIGAQTFVGNLTGTATRALCDGDGNPLVPVTRKINNKPLTGDISLTPTDIGAAPAGYGLGGLATKVTGEDLNTKVNGGWHWWQTATNAPLDWCYMLVNPSYGLQSCTQIAFSMLSATVIQRMKVGDTWGAWEWVNPPMQVGVEYRTTERWQGKAVYTMCVSCGALPNNGSKYIENILPQYITAISVTGYGIGPDSSLCIPNKDVSVTTNTVHGYLNITATAELGTYTESYLMVKYVKN